MGPWWHSPAEGSLRLTPTRQSGRLLQPLPDQRFVEVVLVDVDPASGLALPTRRHRSQQGAAEEGDLHVTREDVEAHEPALPRNAIEGGVPLHRLARPGDVAHDERVEAPPDVLLPARNRGDVR